MDIPIAAKVELLDGDGGHTTRVLVDPITRTITHLIVREPGLLGVEREVPIELVVESDPERVRLRLTRDGLRDLPPLEETRYVTAPGLLLPYSDETVLAWPTYGLNGQIQASPYYPVDGRVPVDHENIPPGELAVRQGQRVEAIDGPIGRIDELLVDPVSERITHLRMHEGHLWGRRIVTIPVDQIERIEDDAIHLTLSKRQVEALPTMPVRPEGR
jgi:hypothetical protein